MRLLQLRNTDKEKAQVFNFEAATLSVLLCYTSYPSSFNLKVEDIAERWEIPTLNWKRLAIFLYYSITLLYERFWDK